MEVVEEVRGRRRSNAQLSVCAIGAVSEGNSRELTSGILYGNVRARAGNQVQALLCPSEVKSEVTIAQKQERALRALGTIDGFCWLGGRYSRTVAKQSRGDGDEV